MYYYLSIGSNIKPEFHAASIVKMLAEEFGPFIVYPFIFTEPYAMHTQNTFLNSLAIVESEVPQHQFKECLNKIEIKLGRDRNDPERSTKDRTADIDILGVQENLDVNFFQQFNEAYISGVLHQKTPADLSAWGLPATDGATTVDFDRRTGNIIVVEKTLNSFIDR